MPKQTIPDLDAADLIPLPAARRNGELSLEETLLRRRSVRELTDEPLTDSEIGQLLWAAQGITHPDGYRTAPSAGALYPLELYVATQAGLYHYECRQHALEQRRKGDLRPAMYRAALEQDAVLDAPAVFVIAAVYKRTAAKYGHSRSQRYVHVEAGHAAQDLLLEAVALGLGAVPVGAFHDERLQMLLSLPPDQEPLYLIPVGHPHVRRQEGRRG